ncbi:MAG: UDP-N-acetylmuramoyl-L-alanine--D-glutamate ligase [Candidatus Edwardsbacteria bacterium]
MTSEFHHKKISVLGLGRSGMAACEALHLVGAKVFVSEERGGEEFQEKIPILKNLKISYEFGGHSEKILQSEIIVISPGIRLDLPILQEAKKRKTPIMGEIELGYRLLPDPFIVAVTGTNGKTTTVALIGEILKADQRSVLIGGNIVPGQPLCSLVKEAKPETILVVEVSTFQIETIDKFKPKIGVITNVAPDHLDRHLNFEEYALLKAKLLSNQDESDYAILNGNDSTVMKVTQNLKSKRVYFNNKEGNSEGAFVQNSKVKVRWQGNIEEICDVSVIRLRGGHNLENVLAAVTVTTILGIKPEKQAKALSTFSGLPHRLEEVRRINNVLYINNSMCTNPMAAKRSLEAFTESVILIAGGKEKETDISIFLETIVRKTKYTFLIGESALRMKDELQKKYGYSQVSLASSLEEAVERASKMASSGDVVLLSPGCASFDMFHNFEERGEKFKKAVMNLNL